MTPTLYARNFKIVVLIAFLARLLVAFLFELGNDEAYYWLYSQHLYPNYFDHPPLVALWIRISTLNLWLDEIPGFLRLGSLISSSAAAWIMYRTAAAAFQRERIGFIAGCLYLVTPYSAITAGVFIMPDAPQMLFWTGSLYFMTQLVRDRDNLRNWIAFGICAGLCIMSKVHGVFLWSGLGLYCLLRKKVWLVRPGIYLALLCTLLCITPLIIWNIQYDFVTYRFHSGRVVPDGHHINVLQFLKELGGQFSFNNPFNVVLIIAGLVGFKRASREDRKPVLLYALTGLPLALILLGIASFRQTLPHWSGPAYVAMMPIAAFTLDRIVTPGRTWPALLRWNLALFIVFLLVWSGLNYAVPGTMGLKQPPRWLGKGDVTLDMQGWEESGDAFQRWADSIPSGPDYFVCPYWWGAHIEYYFAHERSDTMVAIGALQSVRHYAWVDRLRRPSGTVPDSAWCVVPSDEWYDVRRAFQTYYNRFELKRVITANRNGLPSHHFEIWELSDPKRDQKRMLKSAFPAAGS